MIHLSPTPQRQQVSPTCAGEPPRLERCDTRLRDFTALTPFVDARRPPPAPCPAPLSFWRESLALVDQHLEFGRRRLLANDHVYLCGEPFRMLYLISSGPFKLMSLAPDGREQPAGLYFKGDWLGFDGIPTGRHGCSALAMDDAEVWSIGYDELLRASAQVPMVLRVVLAAMSAQLASNRDAQLSMSTLRADARVANFLLQWAQALAQRGLKVDEITVQMTRTDIGNYLNMTMESVSRAFSRLARCGLIEFNEKGRRTIGIPDLVALSEFVQISSEPEFTALQ